MAMRNEASCVDQWSITVPARRTTTRRIPCSSDFKKFLFRGNVVDLAVAVIIGAAFGAIVAAITTGLITPLVGMIFSKDFTEMTFRSTTASSATAS